MRTTDDFLSILSTFTPACSTLAFGKADFTISQPTELASTHAFTCSLFHFFTYFLALGPLEAPTLFVSNLLSPLFASALPCGALTLTSAKLTANFLAFAAAPFDTFLCHFSVPFVFRLGFTPSPGFRPFFALPFGVPD